MAGETDLYVCPFCKGPLEIQAQALCCLACNRTYPVIQGIPDFLAEEMVRSSDPVLQWAKKLDRNMSSRAGIYESRFWYSLVVNLYMGRNTTNLAGLVKMVKKAIAIERGSILDVACGPGTYGRRVASPTRQVYGIDISMAMLRKGVEYVQRDRIPNVHFARTRAETLPFSEGMFDAAICSGSLHLFPDPALVLREISRTMKPGAPLAVITFIAGDKGLLRFERIRRSLRGLHIFEIPELENDLAQAGFIEFKPQVFGSGIFFTAQKVR